MTNPAGQQAAPLTPDQRYAVLQQELIQVVGNGARVEAQWPPDRAIICWPANVNHVVHAILSLLTAGLWLFVWLLIAITTKPRRLLLTVDPGGRVHYSPAGVQQAMPA